MKTDPVTNEIQANILVVDDQEDMRIFFRRVLEKSNHTVATAACGTEALEQLDGGEFDLILLDIVMPGMDGIEVLKEVRKKYSKTQLPVIMVTVKGEEVDIEEALFFGANEYIVKPISYLELLVRIRDFLSRRRKKPVS